MTSLSLGKGVVIETRTDPTMRFQAQVQSDMGLVPVKVLPIDDDRLFLQFCMATCLRPIKFASIL